MSSSDMLQSPILIQLEEALKSGAPSAVEAFWKRVKIQGTPLIEPYSCDETHVLVTFLWRDTNRTGNVVVVRGPAAYDFANNRMQHIENTDIWYKTYQMRADARFGYFLSLNDPLTIPMNLAAMENRGKTFIIDPLNLHPFPADDPRISTVSLPNAPIQPWHSPRPYTPRGHVNEFTITSEILQNTRKVWVYTPHSYADNLPHRLLLLLDGFEYLNEIPTPVILDNLIAEKMIPPMVAVFVGNVDAHTRNHELLHNRDFARFLSTELCAWIHNRYCVSYDPKESIISGASYGGFAAAYTALNYPEVFGNVLCQSGEFGWAPQGEREAEWLAKQFMHKELLPIQFYLEAGLLESPGVPMPPQFLKETPSTLLSNRHMRDVLRAKGYTVHYIEYNGGHDYICWRGGFVGGLSSLTRSKYR